jgi:hypothetical protein
LFEYIIQNAKELEKEKPEDRGYLPLSSGSVPPTVLFSEPFIKDLDLLWRVNFKIY